MKNKISTEIEADKYNSVIKKYPRLFKLFGETVSKYLRGNYFIGDIGSGPGTLIVLLKNIKVDFKIYCLDKNKKYIDYLNNLAIKNIEIKGRSVDAKKLPKDFNGLDLITINMSLHEIIGSRYQKSQLPLFVRKLFVRLKSGGMVILGETYYPGYLSDREVERYIKRQKKEIGHADLRESFPSPELIEKNFKTAGFKLIKKRTIFPYSQIKREYAVYIFKK